MTKSATAKVEIEIVSLLYLQKSFRVRTYPDLFMRYNLKQSTEQLILEGTSR
jgi:hypothetical protein